jgi:hypothetical protein
MGRISPLLGFASLLTTLQWHTELVSLGRNVLVATALPLCLQLLVITPLRYLFR